MLYLLLDIHLLLRKEDDMESSSHRKYRQDPSISCFVPSCKNTALLSPGTHFFPVPHKNRSEWCAAVKKVNVPKRSIYICEEHIDLEEDLSNYENWRLGVRGRLKERVPVIKNIGIAELQGSVSEVLPNAVSRFENKGILCDPQCSHKSVQVKPINVTRSNVLVEEGESPSNVGTTIEFSETENKNVVRERDSSKVMSFLPSSLEVRNQLSNSSTLDALTRKIGLFIVIFFDFNYLNMIDFEDFIEFVYDNPYDYVFRQYETPQPRKIAAGSQREYREKQKSEHSELYEKRRQQSDARVLEHSRRKQVEKKEQRRQRRELEQHVENQQIIKRVSEPTDQLPCIENEELLQTRTDVKSRRNIRNLQGRIENKRKRNIEELRKNIKEITKKHNCLARKYNRQQKKIEQLEETCKYLKTELKSLKVRHTIENTECEGVSEMLHENIECPVHVKMELAFEDDPLSLTSHCNTSTDVKLEEEISEENPI